MDRAKRLKNDAVTAVNVADAAPVELHFLAWEEGPQKSEQCQPPDGRERRSNDCEYDGESAANGAAWLQYRESVGCKLAEQPPFQQQSRRSSNGHYQRRTISLVNIHNEYK